MKRNLLSIILLISMFLGLISSASASAVSVNSTPQQSDQSSVTMVVARVYFSSRQELDSLASRYDILNVDQVQGYALILLSQESFVSLQKNGVRLEIDEAKTKLLTAPHLPLPGQGTDSIPGYPCYRTVEETYGSMANLAANHPNLAELTDIGDSWDKYKAGGPAGYEIYALRLTNENFGIITQKPAFFLMAEIHAREYVTAETAMRYAELLVDNYGVDPDITWLLDYFRVYIVTMTNPDGRKYAESGEMWRKNTDNDDGCTTFPYYGTDLNRNHTFKWNMGGSSGYPCDETYHGPSAGSEPEVQAIEFFVRSLFPDQRGPGDTDPAPIESTGTFITLHSAAGLVLWPWGWTGATAPNDTQLQTLGRHLAFYNGYTPQQSWDLYQTSGTSDEFAYGELGVAGFTFEMGDDFFQSCSSFESTVYPDNRDSLLYAIKTARRPYINPAGPDSNNLSASPAAVVAGQPVLLTATASDTHYVGGEPMQNIAEARYSIDNPSWIAGTTTYPMTASDGAFNETTEDIQATIDTTGLTAGRHIIFVESRDSGTGLGVPEWGVVSATFMYIVEPGVSPVIEGYVRAADTGSPLAATITAGLFNADTDPATGYYSMTVISGTYDMVASAENYANGYATGVVAHDYETIQQDFDLTPVCTLFSDDVESGNLGWTAQFPWAITTEASHSPTHSWTDSPGGPYASYRNVSLTSPVFDLEGASGVILNFWHTYQTEAGFDFAYVEYNTGGTTWTNVATYDGNQPWTAVQLPIPALDNQANARIRFRFTSDSNTVYDGWHIDDITLASGGSICMPPSADFTTNAPVHYGQPVVFTNQTEGAKPLTYAWDFGDGVGTSSQENPSYTYATVGSYTVTLEATNNLGIDSVTHTVTVEPLDITNVSLIQVTPGPITPGDSVEFSADLSPDATGAPYSYTIDFGDGEVITSTSTLDDPLMFSHVFDVGGVFTTQVWVQNAGMLAPVTDSLEVKVGYMFFLPIAEK